MTEGGQIPGEGLPGRLLETEETPGNRGVDPPDPAREPGTRDVDEEIRRMRREWGEALRVLGERDRVREEEIAKLREDVAGLDLQIGRTLAAIERRLAEG